MSRTKPLDLSSFHNAGDVKMSWDKRARLIKESYPSVISLDWDRVFRVDGGVLSAIMQDVLKADLAPEGRPGPRPSLDKAEALRRLRQMAGEDYSELPFLETLRLMSRGASVRALAHKTNLDRNIIHRLLTGRVEPDAYTMTQIAKAYGKHGSYFQEYRAAFAAAAVYSILMWSPEASINVYRRLQKSRETK